MQGTSATAAPYPPPPQGYVPAGAQPYAHPPSAEADSQRSSSEPYSHDYGAAIDPALERSGNTVHELKRGLDDGSDRHKGDPPLRPKLGDQTQLSTTEANTPTQPSEPKSTSSSPFEAFHHRRPPVFPGL